MPAATAGVDDRGFEALVFGLQRHRSRPVGEQRGCRPASHGRMRMASAWRWSGVPRRTAGVALRRSRVLLHGDHAARDARAGIAGRLGRVVVGRGMHDERAAGDVVGRAAAQADAHTCAVDMGDATGVGDDVVDVAGMMRAGFPALPCALALGLKWPPALAASAALQSPVSWMWKPWLLPGASPPMSPVTCTPLPIGINISLPLTRLPDAGARLLVATAAVPVDGITATGALVGGAAAQAESAMVINGTSNLGRIDVSFWIRTDAVRRVAHVIAARAGPAR